MKKIISKIMLIIFVVSTILCNVNNNAYAEVNKNKVYGKDRIETSIKISQEGWQGSSDTVVIAQGYDYADALCAAPLAKKFNAPILLSEKNGLRDDVVNEIRRLKATKIFIIGGTGALSQNIEKQLKDININSVERICGQDRYETSIKVAKFLGTFDSIVISTGNGYADSLSIAPIAAQKCMPIILTNKDKLTEDAINFIKASNVKNTYIIGGTGVISNDVEKSVPNAKRINGNDRYETNYEVINYFKDELKFDNIYVARGDGPNGNEFADALSGSALASKTSSPMVLVQNNVNSQTVQLLKSQMAKNINVIALGGDSAVKDEVIKVLYDFLAGNTSILDYSINALIDGISSNIQIDDWAALDLNKAGKGITTDYLINLKKTIKDGKGVLNQPTDYERTVIGILGAGEEPTNFEGYNLVEKIYNNNDMDNQGVNAYIFGLIALDAGNFKIPSDAKWTREKLIKAILECKTEDDGWDYGGSSADPDMTAMALSALSPYYNTNKEVKTAVDKAILRLSQLQTQNGGFKSSGNENADSLAMIIIALCDNGIDPATDKRFIKNGKNPIDTLLGYALSDNKGFGYADNKSSNEMATEQGLRALVAYRLFKAEKGSIYKNVTPIIKNEVNLNSPNLTYDGNSNSKKDIFNVKISADNITLKNVNIAGELIIDPGVSGSSNIENVTAAKITIKSGGTNSVHFSSVKADLVVVDSTSNVRIEAKGGTKIKNTQVYSSSIIDVPSDATVTFGQVSVESKSSNKLETVELRGKFADKIEIKSNVKVVSKTEKLLPEIKVAGDSKLAVTFEGNFENVIVEKLADITVGINSKISKVEANANTNIKLMDGSSSIGVIEKANGVEVKGDISQIKVQEQTNSNTDTFTLTITKNNGSITMKKVTVKIDNNKNAMDYLKSIATVIESGKPSFINGIDGLSNVLLKDLPIEKRQQGILGIDWFIYSNGKFASSGATGIYVKPGDILNFDYHEWDWHALVSSDYTGAMPIEIKLVSSSNLKVGDSINVQAVCVYRGVYGAVVKLDGNQVATTDIDGYATITLNTAGIHTISVEKDGGSKEKTINVAGNVTPTPTPTPTQDVKLVEIKTPISFNITKNSNGILSIEANSNDENDYITLTLYDASENLVYINQGSKGKTQLSTILKAGKYHGTVKASSSELIEICEFEVK